MQRAVYIVIHAQYSPPVLVRSVTDRTVKIIKFERARAGTAGTRKLKKPAESGAVSDESGSVFI